MTEKIQILISGGARNFYLKGGVGAGVSQWGPGTQSADILNEF